MKQDFVVVRGKRYNSGDTITVWKYNNWSHFPHKSTATFIDCDEEKDEYTFVMDGLELCYNRVCFYRTVCDESEAQNSVRRIVKTSKKATFKDELNIDGLLVAWVWYIFIMAVAIIFNDRMGIWALSSVVFFDYRSRKLKEAGYK